MSVIVGSVSSQLGQSVDVPIALDVDYWGVSCRLHYDPAALDYESFTAVSGFNVNVNLVQAGELAIAAFVGGTSPPIPQDFLTIRFNVNGSSALTLTELGASDAAGMDVAVTGVDGQVTIEDTVMNYQLYWDLVGSETGVTLALVFVGDSTDPNDGTFGQVAEAVVPFTVENIGGVDKQLSPVFPLAANVGTKYAYVVFGDAEGDFGPIHTPIPVSTDVALPVATGVGYRVVP